MIFIIFGSRSDEKVYRPIADSLKKKGVKHEVYVCSAHRSPGYLSKILKEKHDMVIAGAGLAAHLPGAVAANTVAPVVGVPCNGAYGGLDSLLSIVQMPPGVPVLGVGIENGKFVADRAPLFFEKYEKVNLIYDRINQNNKRIVGCMDVLNFYGIDFVMAVSPKKDMVNINFTGLNNDVEQKFVTINVPMKNETRPKDSCSLVKLMSKGFWVGLNRGDNAAHAAAQIIAIRNEEMRNKISKFRREEEKRIIEMNTNAG